jgi:hypothetical protein
MSWRDDHIRELRAALEGYLNALPQCTCGENTGCGMGAARAAARWALRLSEAPDEEMNHE